MNGKEQRVFVLLIIFGLLASIVTVDAASNWRLRGSVGGWGYGYQTAYDVERGPDGELIDTGNKHHLWLVERTNLSLYKTDSPWSVHFSGGWIGDYQYQEGIQDDWFRWTRGYIGYGDLGSQVSAKLGRFFLVRGPAVGVLDGVSAAYRFTNGFDVAAFGGLWGPLSRKFEFAESGDNLAFGGEVGWTGRDLLMTELSRFTLSYASIERDGLALRHRIGFNSYHRFENGWSWRNMFRFRTEGNVLSRLVSRVRYSDEMCARMIEVAALSPEIYEDSWFSDFEDMTYYRVRASTDRYLVEDMWGLGLDAAALLEDQAGYRFGPYLKFPFGRIGYRFYFGDQPAANGLWGQVSATPWQQVEVYAQGSFATYEWEAFDSVNPETGDVLALYGGVNVMPPWVNNLRVNLEYQHFQTPQFDQDRRFMAGVQWGFDTAEVNR